MTQEASSRLAQAAQLLKEELNARLSEDADFAERERLMHKLANSMVQQVQREDLQAIADDFESAMVVVNGQTYRRFKEGTVLYHGRSGPLEVRRWLYRQTGVRNGPTVVPLELRAGLMERTTPALGEALMRGTADTHSRELHRHLELAQRVPPSRTAMEHNTSKLAAALRERMPTIEPVLRGHETVPAGAASVSIGLDRVSVPMEEPASEDPDPSKRVKKRKKPYERKEPAPIEVNYRMAYVGTVSVLDEDCQQLRALRYFASAGQGPANIVHSMVRDLKHLRSQREELPLGIVQDGAPEMWRLLREGLGKQHIQPEVQLIDRYHLSEHLGNALRATGHTAEWCKEKLAEWNLQLDADDSAIDSVEAWLKTACHTATGRNRSDLLEELVYLKNNKDRMRYAKAISAGLPIGSGATEGACKSIVKMRACRSGQRWHTEGLDNVLTLRALSQSDRLPGAIQQLRQQKYLQLVQAAA